MMGGEKMDKRFICIWKTNKTCTMSASAMNIVVEKLFIPFGQYKKWAEMKNRTSGSLFEEW